MIAVASRLSNIFQVRSSGSEFKAHAYWHIITYMLQVGYTIRDGLAFCLMTPVYVGLLTLYWPRVNIATMRVTSLVGLIIGLYNMYANFGINPGRTWWNGILHIPLLIISVYGLILSLKCPKGKKHTAAIDTNPTTG